MLETQDAGLVSQREACERWAANQGVTIVGRHEDRLSGATPADERPGLMAALEDLRRQGAGVLLVANRSRIARDVMVAAIIERLAGDFGGRVISADGVTTEDTPEGQLIRGILDQFAAYERARIRARMRMALRRKKERGEHVGGAPYGWKAEAGRLVEIADEQATVRQIRALRGEGIGVPSIARWLMAHGVPCRGNGWHSKSIRRILARDCHD
jgi:DNA invertase Pin-like site-specific DNA recombinase